MSAFGFAGRARHRRHLGLARRPVTGEILDDGWRMRRSGNGALPDSVQVDRTGFDSVGAPTTHRQHLPISTRVRMPWPDHALPSPTDLAMSDHIFASDRISGTVNGSLRESPKPIAAWVMPSNLIVGDTISWEIVAFHRDGRADPGTGIGRQVACVKVRGSDGVNRTDWQVVAVTSLSSGVVQEDQPSEVFAGTLDISTLGEGAVWLEAEVYPWVGVEASVLRSEDVSSRRGFSRRYYCKDAAKAATPPLVYVASTGNNETGAVSTDAATAQAAPCLTVGGAMERAHAVLGSSAGALDGLRIRIIDMVNIGTPSFGSYAQDIAGVVIEHAPGVSRTTAVAVLDKSFRPFFSTSSLGENALMLMDVTLRLGGSFAFSGEPASNLHVTFWNIALDTNGQSQVRRASSHFSAFGLDIVGRTSFSTTTSGELRICRGVTGDLDGRELEQWVTIGCTLTNAGNASFSNTSEDGRIIYNNAFLSPAAGTTPILFNRSGAGAGELGSIAVVQNLFETTDTTGSVNCSLSADNARGDLTHCVVLHNTNPGADGIGRWNVANDDTSGTRRAHGYVTFKANLLSQLNTRGDIFAGASLALADASERTGNFAFHHGAGCAGNYTMYPNAGGGGLACGFADSGIGSVEEGGDPLFIDDRSVSGTGGVYDAGAGDGDYRLAGESPARALLAQPVLAFDMQGQPRGTGAQAAGCYA